MAVKPLILIFDGLFGIVTFLQMAFHFETVQSWILFVAALGYYVLRGYWYNKAKQQDHAEKELELRIKYKAEGLTYPPAKKNEGDLLGINTYLPEKLAI